MLSDEELIDVITTSEARDEEPPTPGSVRYEAIWAKAMGAPAVTRHRRRTRWWTAAAGAAVVGIAGAFVVLDGRDSPAASAAILDAADNLGEIESLQGVVVSVEGEARSQTTIRVSGDDADTVTTTQYADGHTESATAAIVDGVEYETVEGVTMKRPFEFAPFPGNYGEAASAVLAIVLADQEPVAGGVETISALEAQRYDVTTSATAADRLTDLAPAELAWFELEYPGSVDHLSVWIADELIVQIEVHHTDEVDGSTTRTTFSNFNAEFAITVPPGPYIDGE